MSRWEIAVADLSSDLTLKALAREILRRAASGRFAIATDGFDASARTHFANNLARALRSLGRSAVRLTALPCTDDDTVLTAVGLFLGGAHVKDFEGLPPDAVLIVDGWMLLRPSIRHAWDFAVSLETSGRPASDGVIGQNRHAQIGTLSSHTADVSYDVTDFDRPMPIHAKSSARNRASVHRRSP